MYSTTDDYTYGYNEEFQKDDVAMSRLQDFCYRFNLLACRFDNLDLEHISAETFDYAVAANNLVLIGAYVVVPRIVDGKIEDDGLGWYGNAYTYKLYSECCELLNLL